jgi:anti-sigma factor RsiW
LESLPWFLTGMLDVEEHTMVAQHLAVCADCRAELQSQRALQDAVKCNEPTPGYEASLAKLVARLDSRPAAQPVASTTGVGWLLGMGRPVPAWAGLAMAVQLGLVVALGMVLYRADREVATYHTLASTNAGVAARGNLVVVFDPETQLRVVRGILIASGARIVDGPLASGGYVLDASPADLPATLAWLRTQRTVALAERLDSPGAR